VHQTLPRLVLDLELAMDANGHVLVDQAQQTSRPGVFAAGDVSSFEHQQVIHAAASGVTAAKAVVDCLTRRRRFAMSTA
jgi:NADH-dependent peroxiredoxin subunit F